jgi:hypothetical protein
VAVTSKAGKTKATKFAHRRYHAAVSGGTVDVCGNCGAPLYLNEDGECRWCRSKIRARPAPSRGHSRGRPAVSWRWNRRIAAITAIAIAAAAGLGIGIASYVGAHQPGPPTATASGQSAADQAVAPGSTDLQALRQDFGPWHQLTGQVTDGPALLLLESGGAYASERWTVPSAAAGWAQDLGGNVTSVAASGDHATITDADGIGYTVGINQTFIISSNPGTVLLISPDSTVMSMSLAQATAVRQPLAR